MNCSKTSIQSEECRMEKIVEERPDITQQKRIIRKQVLAVRDSISAGNRKQYNAVIRKHVLTQSVYDEAQIILAYASYRSEVDTTALIELEGWIPGDTGAGGERFFPRLAHAAMHSGSRVRRCT